MRYFLCLAFIFLYSCVLAQTRKSVRDSAYNELAVSPQATSFIDLLCAGQCDAANYPPAKLDSLREMNYQIQKARAEKFLNRLKFENAALDHQTRLLEHSEKGYHAHASRSSLIFWGIIAIVVCGMTFAGLQFSLSHKIHKLISSDQKAKSTMRGAELTSSVLATIVLLLSMLFFYLYIAVLHPSAEHKIQSSQVTRQPEQSTSDSTHTAN